MILEILILEYAGEKLWKSILLEIKDSVSVPSF